MSTSSWLCKIIGLSLMPVCSVHMIHTLIKELDANMLCTYDSHINQEFDAANKSIRPGEYT